MNGMFLDDEGNVSSMNLVWFFSLLTIVGMWIFLSIFTGQLQHVTGGDALWFTSLFSGKLVQNFYEKKNPLPEGIKKSSLIQDKNGKTSPARFVWIIAVLGIVFTWAWISWKSKGLVHFSSGDAAWFTALFGSKVGHSIIERGGFSQGDYEEGDYDESEGFETMSKGLTEGGSSGQSELIAQLQETVRVQSEFNKNLVNTLNPKKDESND